MSGHFVGRPGLLATPDIRALSRMSDHNYQRASKFWEFVGCPPTLPGVWDFQPRQMFGLCPGCPAPCYPDSNWFACICRMSGLHAGCRGRTPDIRTQLSKEHFVLVLSSRCPGVYAGCSGSPCTPDFRASLPDVWLVLSRGCFNLVNLRDVGPCAGCLGFPDMPDVRAWPPDVRPLCLYLCFCSILQVARQAGCPAPMPGCSACPFTCTTTATFVLTLHIALPPTGEG